MKKVYLPQDTVPEHVFAGENLTMLDVHQGPYLITVDNRGTVFVDIDGTVADLAHRRVYVRSNPKNWPAFERAIPLDAPIQPVIDAVNRLYMAGWTVVMMSGRSERSKAVTVEWLAKYGVQYHAIYMRREFEYEADGVTPKKTRLGKPLGDYRRDDIVKRELLDVARADGYDPDVVFDDRDQVVAMWRKNGIPVVQVAEGDF
jgi:hypothetical protein